MKKIFYSVGLVLLAACGPTTQAYVSNAKGEKVASKKAHNKLEKEGWDKMDQPKFWKELMETSPDTVVLSVAQTREIVASMPKSEWDKMSNAEQEAFRKQAREERGLSADAKIYSTRGKKGDFPVEEMVPKLERATEIFTERGTDPFFAKAILLIETPGEVRMSNVGAHGAFQLMPDVARAQGLKVGGGVDERLDFDKCATAAADFIGENVVPETKRVLDQLDIKYDENDTWFKLVVMHSYHAGPGNVKKVLAKVQDSIDTNDGQQILEAMWTNTAGGFQNASQNYSQLALAALMRFSEHMQETGANAQWAQV